jgi:hypothetical protein
MPDSGLVLLPFLAAAIERIVEIISPALASIGLNTTELKRIGGLVIAAALAALITYVLDFDLVSPLLKEGSVTADQGKALTLIALAGGSAPVHELIRLIEEAKKNNKAINEARAAGGGQQ